jgi:hypothetical protein
MHLLPSAYITGQVIAADIGLFVRISSSHGGEYDVQNYLLGCTAV